MSGINPTGPSQPTQQTSLNQASNPASKTTDEEQKSHQPNAAATFDRRTAYDVPSTHTGAPQPSGLGAGDTGPLKERDVSRSDAAHQYSENPDLDGEQMRMAGEGEVSHAVKSGGGGGHLGEEDLAGDLDRKAREHEAELKRRGERTGKEIEEEENEDWTGKKSEVDVSEALAGRGNKVVLAPEGAS